MSIWPTIGSPQGLAQSLEAKRPSIKRSKGRRERKDRKKEEGKEEDKRKLEAMELRPTEQKNATLNRCSGFNRSLEANRKRLWGSACPGLFEDY